MFGSCSQTTLPSASILTYLYWKLVPAGRVIVADHSGLEDEYPLADSATPLVGLQLPNCGIDPTMNTLSPHEVEASSLKVTATAVAVVHFATIVLLVDLTVVLAFLVEVVARASRPAWLCRIADAEMDATRASKGKTKEGRILN